MGQELERALRYRNCAEELRIIAPDKSTSDNRQTLTTIADDYDRLAESLEAIHKSQPRPIGF